MQTTIPLVDFNPRLCKDHLINLEGSVRLILKILMSAALFVGVGCSALIVRTVFFSDASPANMDILIFVLYGALACISAALIGLGLYLTGLKKEPPDTGTGKIGIIFGAGGILVLLALMRFGG